MTLWSEEVVIRLLKKEKAPQAELFSEIGGSHSLSTKRAETALTS
jgi:hypothetical protein